jgi:hypothetical protein
LREPFKRARRATARIARGRRGWRFLFVSVAAFLFASIVMVGWRSVSSESSITCQVGFQPLRDRNNGYIEFFVDKEEPLEPVFDGGYFINLTDAYGKDAVRRPLPIFAGMPRIKSSG